MNIIMELTNAEVSHEMWDICKGDRRITWSFNGISIMKSQKTCVISFNVGLFQHVRCQNVCT